MITAAAHLCWSQKTLEREALPRRLRKLAIATGQLERIMREHEARLPNEKQLRLNFQPLTEERALRGCSKVWVMF